MREIRIPALTALTTADADAIRNIVATLVKEIESLGSEIQLLRKTQESMYASPFARSQQRRM